MLFPDAPKRRSLLLAAVSVCLQGGALFLGGAGCSDDRGTGKGDMAQTGLDLVSSKPVSCGLVGGPHQLSGLGGQHASPRLAANTKGFVVAWLTGIPGTTPTYRIDASLTDRAGNRLGPNIPLSAQAIAEPDAPALSPISGGTSIAWTRRNGTTTDIMLTTLDGNGQRLDAAGSPCDPAEAACGVFPATSSGAARQPFLERPQGDTHTTGATQNQLGLAFVDSREYPCPMAPCPTSNHVYWKRVQSNGLELVFEKKLTTLFGARYAAPRLAFDGTRQGVVWRDETLGSPVDLYFTTVDALGQTASLLQKIGTVSGSNSTSSPDLVWTGAEYALVTTTGTDATAAVLFQRQNSAGLSTLSPRAITFGGTSCTPTLAFDGQAYGVAYQTNCGKPDGNVVFVRIDAQGVRYALDGTSCGDSVDPTCGQLQITQNTTVGASRPEVVYGGDGGFAIAWMQGPEGPSLRPGVPLDVYLQRVDCK